MGVDGWLSSLGVMARRGRPGAFAGRRALVGLLALLVCLTGCGGGGPGGGGAEQESGQAGESGDRTGEPEDQEAPGAPGAPGGEGGGEALGAPIRVPQVSLAQDPKPEDVQRSLKAALAADPACKNQRCPTVEISRENAEYTECQYLNTRPKMKEPVERDAKILVVTGTRPCEKTGTPGPTSSSSSSTTTTTGPEPPSSEEPQQPGSGDGDGGDGPSSGDS